MANTPEEKQKSRAGFIGLSFSIAVFFTMIWWYNQGPNGIQQRIADGHVRNEINAHLPLGSTRAEVNAFLTQEHIEHGNNPDGGTNIVAFPEYHSPFHIINKGVPVVFIFGNDSKLTSYRLGMYADTKLQALL